MAVVDLEPDGNLIAVLSEEIDLDFGPDIDFNTCGRTISPLPQAGSSPNGNGGLASSTNRTAAEGQAGGSNIVEGSPAADLDWPSYVQKFKETFLKARPLEDVAAHARTMGFLDFMDYAVKLMPKDVKIESNINFRAMIDGLGPIDKEQYRVGAQQEPVTELEFCEVEDVSGELV